MNIPEPEIHFGPGPFTAELIDEEDEDGIVVIKNASGGHVAYMPRAVYEQIRNLGEKMRVPK